MKSIVIIPALAEKDGLSKVVDSIPPELGADVLVLNGGDNGWEQGLHDRVMTIAVPRGNGLAVRAGLEFSYRLGYDYTYRLDGDGQNDPAYFGAVRRQLVRGADFVVGARYHPASDVHSSPPVDRVLLNVMVRSAVERLTGLNLHDVVSGFWGLNRRTVSYLVPGLTTVNYGLTIEIILRLWRNGGFTIREVPHSVRYGGTTKLDALYGLEPDKVAQRSQRAGEYLAVLTRTLSELGVGGVWEKLITQTMREEQNHE